MSIRFANKNSTANTFNTFSRIRQVAPVCTLGPGNVSHDSAQWCHLANTMDESSGVLLKMEVGITGVAKGLKVPCLFMIAEVSIRCQKNPEVGIRRIPPNTPLDESVRSCCKTAEPSESHADAVGCRLVRPK